MYYILGIIIIAVVALVVIRFRKKEQTHITGVEPGKEPETEPRQIASDCCGAHEICEFDEADVNEEIITYFDDEELDELRNDLREVLYTLRTEEIGKWLISIGRRHIHLPAILQQEARQLMTER